MDMRQEPVETLILSNNLELRIYNRSKKLAGDRWTVEAMMEIPVPLTAELRERLSPDKALVEQFVQEHGDPFLYRHHKARHFIDESEKERTFQALKEDFLRANRNYLSHPLFAHLVVAKAFREWEERRRWWR
ncbi:MAG: hypothetical protein ACUVSA_02955 [Desulfosoma sp.]|uniref:hypothetical protein n=1 Tax=Desulfosoma sp. TaxID=2603217 RepID=UPI00404B2B54